MRGKTCRPNTQGIGFSYSVCIFSLASSIDDIQEEEESHYVDKLKEYHLYADSIR